MNFASLGLSGTGSVWLSLHIPDIIVVIMLIKPPAPLVRA